jgi:hypothetical protein
MAYTNGLSLYVVFPDLYGINEYTSSNISYIPIDNGSVFEDTYNETLDTGVIKLSCVSTNNYSRLVNLSVYDTALIYSSTDGVNFTLIRRMLVDKFSEINSRTSTPTYHTFEIYLFSETKALEKIILPNVSITQRASSPFLNVGTILARYIKEYSPCKRVYISGESYPEKIFSLDSNTLSHFSTIESKDFQLSKPTLRQALTELMLIDDCIPVVKNGVISHISLSTRLSDISSSSNLRTQFNKIDRIVTQQDSSEYSNELNLTLENVTNNEQESVDNFVNVSEMVGFRNDDNYILENPNNLRLVTQFPIYNNPRIIMCFEANYYGDYDTSNHANGVAYYEYDISDLVSEKSNWLKKPTCYNQTLRNIGDLESYKNSSLYYTRGNNYIEGFGQKIEYFFIQAWTTYQIDALYKIIGNSFIPITLYETSTSKRFQYDTCTGLSGTGNEFNFINGIYFKIQYQTLASLKARVGKVLPQRHFIEAIDNQQSSYADSERLGIYEYSKVNRLGNRTKIMSGRFTNYSDIPTLAQTYENYVIYKRSIKFYKHQYIVDLFLTENYILRDYFTGVSSKIRSWAIAQGKEALERNDVIKTYMEFSFSQKSETHISYKNSYFLFDANYFASSLIKETTATGTSSLNNAMVKAKLSSGYQPSNTDYSYCLEERSYIFGNSIIFSFGFSDNYIASRYISTDNNTYMGGWGQSDYSYVDNNGENVGLIAYLLSGYDAGKGTITPQKNWSVNGTNNVIYGDFDTKQKQAVIDNINSVISYQQQVSWEKPIVGGLPISGSYGYTIIYNNKKDNREITVLSNQVEFCSDTNDIVFGKAFIYRQSAVKSVIDCFDKQILPSNVYGLVNLESIDTLSSLISYYPPADNTSEYAIVGGTTLYQSYKYADSTGYQWVKPIPITSKMAFFSYRQGSTPLRYYQYVNGNFVQINSSFDFKCYGFNSTPFNVNNGEPTLPSGGILLSEKFTKTAQSNGLSVHISFPSTLTYTAYAICDNDDNVILAWNGDYNGVWLNQKVIRDDYIYDGDSKVGTIVVS